MRIGRVYVALWAIFVAIAIGLLAAWYAGAWSTSPAPESRAREAVDAIQHRIRSLTR